MKKPILSLCLTFLVSLISNRAICQVPDWIKNALPVTEKHLKKIDKKGDEYMEKYKSYPEGSPERTVYYRVKYISYLQRLESMNNEISNVKDSLKPFPFPLFVSPEHRASLASLNDENSTARVTTDTLLYVVDLFESFSKAKPIKDDTYSYYDIIVEDEANNKFILRNAYNSYELEQYPHFTKWKQKYLLYSLKENQRIAKIEKAKQDEELLKRKEKDAEEERKNKELQLIVLCNTSTDDFTGLKTIETNQRRLVAIENETVKEMYPNEDYEMFVCAFKGIKSGDTRNLEVYLKFKTERPLEFYGIIEKGALIEFKLDNNKIIKLPFTASSAPTIKSVGSYSFYENSLLLTNKDAIEFVGSKVKKIRIHFSKGYKDYDVATENGDMFIKLIECIK